jgi:hypothetical protein
MGEVGCKLLERNPFLLKAFNLWGRKKKELWEKLDANY